MLSGRRGFTLIELLIVIIIIGVLATLAIPQYTSFVERARAAEAVSMISAIKGAQAAYKVENSSYTTTIPSLSLLTGIVTDSASTAQYWWYEVTAAGTQSFTVKANRSAKAGGATANYVQFLWSDTTGAVWSGNPTSIVPKS